MRNDDSLLRAPRARRAEVVFADILLRRDLLLLHGRSGSRCFGLGFPLEVRGEQGQLLGLLRMLLHLDAALLLLEMYFNQLVGMIVVVLVP